MPKGEVPVVDKLIDEISEIRLDCHGLSEDNKSNLQAALRLLVKVWNGEVALETTLRGADPDGQGGGEMYVALGELRACPAIRRVTAQPVEPMAYPAGLAI